MSAAALAAGSSATAAAEPPNCTTADVTLVMTGVSANITSYLFSHPDVNNFFTGLQSQDKAEVGRQTKTYLDQNPGVRSELEAIRQPARELRDRCGIPLKAEISGVI